MKASPSQIFKDAELLKAVLSGDPLSLPDACQKRQELCHLLESLLLVDLDYALDKKVEQDLWSFIFRNPISACQSKARDRKKSNKSYPNSQQLSTLLETASGFYLQLLQKLCCAYDIDLPCHPRDSVYGLTKEWIHRYPVAHQPRKSSLLYICQHCLVHLGDIARYRGQSLQAENFYRHAVDLVPSNGQPYNQLALLEAASGEKLSTVFFYVRSLCVQHPFPLAAKNLHSLFAKMSSDCSSCPEGKSRMSAFEYVSIFLQFHAAIHLNSDLKKMDSVLGKLTTSLPALIIAEKFETWQLVQMVAVCLFAIEHAWGVVDVDRNSAHFDESMLSPEELKASSLVEELLVNMLHAFLLPVHASLDFKETANYYTLPAVKVVLDWLLQDVQLLQHAAIAKTPQMWHGLCKLLNDLEVVTKETFDLQKLEDLPLPEDWDLQSFLPLKKSQRRLKFSLNGTSPNEEECTWLRSVRLCKLGETLAGIGMEGVSFLTFCQVDDKRVFKAVHQTESLSEEVLQQIQQLSVTSSDRPLVSGSASESNSLRSKVTHSDSVSQQEVRFKLDESQVRKAESETLNEKPERRVKESNVGTGRERRRQNVAMQAILQQRAAQMTFNNHGRVQENGKDKNMEMNCRPSNLQNLHEAVSTNAENTISSQVKEVPMSRAVHHLSNEQFSQFQQQNHGLNALQQSVDRNEAWIQQYNNSQAGLPQVPTLSRDTNPVNNFALQRVVRAPVQNFSFQPQPPQPQPPQSQPLMNKSTFLAANTPNVVWNCFVAPYQQPAGPQPGAPILMSQPSGQSAPALSRQQFYVMNGGQQELNQVDVASNLLHAYRGATNGAVMQQQDLVRDQVQEHMANQARMWRQENRNEIGTNHLLSQMVGHPPSNPQQLQGTSHDSTYSLFNSPWPSGINLPRATKECKHNNMDPVFMQSHIQSLWSGPGPSPLERLLEQQKQRRDGAMQ